MDPKTRIQALVQKLNEWAVAYYENNQSLVSDEQYDRYLQELIVLEKKYPFYIQTNSPTQRIANLKPNTGLKKLPHYPPMYSLANIFSLTEVDKFAERCKKTLGLAATETLDYVCELKIDGLSLSLHYDHGQLLTAITRGDGQVGEDVLANIKLISEIPTTITFQEQLTVRGEVYMQKTEFERILHQNANLAHRYANPRNLAAGTLRHKIPVQDRHLKAFFYNIFTKNKLCQSQIEVLTFLNQQGFPVNKSFVHASEPTAIKTYITTWEQKHKTLDFEADGIVIKLNNLSYQDQLGYTAKDPRWAVAYKYQTNQAQTILTAVIATTGRTGKITYEAVFKPIVLDGSTISQASLHNWQIVHQLDLHEHDTIYVHKAASIIPQVIGVEITKRLPTAHKIQRIKDCPSCQQKLYFDSVNVDDFCLNLSCPSRQLNTICHFFSKHAMNVQGLAEKSIAKLLTKKLIQTPFDFYNLLDESDNSELWTFKQAVYEALGYKAKSVQNLLKHLLASRQNSLERLLFGLSIRHVGQQTALVLAQKYQSLAALEKAKLNDLITVGHVGTEIASAVVCFFEDNPKILDAINHYHFNQTYLSLQPITTISEINQQFIVITGTLLLPRAQVKTFLETHGATLQPQITAKTNLLIVGDDFSSSKVELAKKQKLLIWTNDEFTKKWTQWTNA